VPLDAVLRRPRLFRYNSPFTQSVPGSPIHPKFGGLLEKVLYPKPRTAALLFWSLLLIVLVVASLRNSRSNLGIMMFFCLIAIVFSVVSSRPDASALKLDSQGFTVRFWFKENTYRWIDVQAFKIITTRYMGIIPLSRSVCFSFSDHYQRNVLLKIAGKIAAFDRKLPDNYGMKAKELLVLLEACRRQAAANGPGSYPISAAPIEPE
jgi:hypothetical protein